jgi:hypothetical protein
VIPARVIMPRSLSWSLDVPRSARAAHPWEAATPPP